MVALQPEQREVQAPAALYYVSVERPAVVEGHPDVRPPASSRDHMMVRQDEAVAGPDHTRPDTPAAAAHLYDAPLRVLDHPHAGQGGGGVSGYSAISRTPNRARPR